MTTLHGPSSEPSVSSVSLGRRVVKGAPEQVVAGTDGGHADDALAAAHDMAVAGLRVIAVAESRQPARDDIRPTLLGLIGVADPPRREAPGIVSACRDAGVDIVMVTGDHPDTARAIASEIGILDRRPLVLLGDDVEAPTPAAHGAVGVFARVRPEQKVAVVDALRSSGHVVAVTGDGVNDAPALRAADIGVAMGINGTEVARQAADLVLADDNLLTVVAAMEEGRRILTNVRRFLRYALSGGLAEILVLVLAPFVGIPIPLLPAQILWVNLLTHGVPGVAFGAEPGDARAMHRGPSSPDESVLGGGLAGQILVGGSLIAVVTLAAGVMADRAGYPVQSVVFGVLSMAQLALALAVRAPRRRFQRRGRALEAAVAASALLQIAAIYAAPLQPVLHTEAIPLTAAVGFLLLSVLPSAILHAARRVRFADGGSESAAAGSREPPFSVIGAGRRSPGER
jgi:Ca2+-transporting ATPase